MQRKNGNIVENKQFIVSPRDKTRFICGNVDPSIYQAEIGNTSFRPQNCHGNGQNLFQQQNF